MIEVEGRWFASTQSSFFALLMSLMPLLLLVHILADSLLRPYQVDIANLADLEFKPLKMYVWLCDLVRSQKPLYKYWYLDGMV